ncbi:MAG TPA: Mur ligase domain-containing protein, partial [Candidatus Aminicenantes bacterium]|nr:Mur ligase domain-containing protein [Candidatus Aminicenantes bacterium]
MIEQSRIKRLHFVGIGGAGMSGIAEVLFNMGFSVRGSDIAENDTVRRLRTLGVPVAIGHRAENLSDAEALIYSSAIDATNPEVATALARKLPVLPRAEMLAELMRMKFALAIAGTHGKTTTTSMIARILTHARLDPTYVVGGRVKIGETGAALGSSRFLVAEADESDGSFLRLLPTIAVITNIENDHLDHYHSMARLTRAFAEFADHVPFYGAVVLHTGCARVRKIVPAIHKRVITCGRRPGNDFVARHARVTPFSARFELV